MYSLGKLLIVSGIVLIALGIAFMLGGRVGWLGRLPGDIYIQKKGITLFFPITTSILISAAVSILLLILRRR